MKQYDDLYRTITLEGRLTINTPISIEEICKAPIKLLIHRIIEKVVDKKGFLGYIALVKIKIVIYN